MLDLTAYKSMEIHRDASKISTLLRNAMEKTPKVNGTSIFRNSEGRDIVAKQSAALLKKDPASYVMPSRDDLEKKATDLGITWKPGYEDRCLPYWGSDERVDRHGDIVEQSWRFENYATNPILLYSHDWELPPIGATLQWEVAKRNDPDYKGDALRLLCFFSDKDTWDWADTVYRLAASGVMKTGSVGFYPGELVYIKDPAERAKLGLGEWGFIYRNNELVEYSPTSVPANAGAYRIMAAAKSAGQLQAADVQVLREIKRRELMSRKAGSKEWKQADLTFVAFWKSFFPNVKVEMSKDIEDPILLDEISFDSQTSVHNPPEERSQKQNDTDGDEQPSIMEQLGALNDRVSTIHDHVTAHTETLKDHGTMMQDVLDYISPDGDEKGAKKTPPSSEREARNPFELMI